MTIIEAINNFDDLKPNSFSQLDKIRWLSRLDGIIKANIIDTHEGGDDITFTPYDKDTPLSTKLLCEAPWDDIYIKWLEAQADYALGEYERYNNSTAAYNTVFSAFSSYYNRTHMPKRSRVIYF